MGGSMGREEGIMYSDSSSLSRASSAGPGLRTGEGLGRKRVQLHQVGVSEFRVDSSSLTYLTARE